MVTLNENSQLVIDVADEQTILAVDHDRIRLAVEQILGETRIGQAEVSVAVVDDQTIRQLNARYLDHDCATDVLSFVLEQQEEKLDGQIVVSAQTAQAEAARYGWPPEDELLLYVVHGALHLVGYDDGTPESRQRMRQKEREALARFSLEPHWDAPAASRHAEAEE